MMHFGRGSEGMENSMSRIMVGARVKEALKDLKESPECSISVRMRNSWTAEFRGYSHWSRPWMPFSFSDGMSGRVPDS